MEPTVIKHHDDLVGWFDVYTLALKSVTHNYHSVTVLGSTMCQGEGFHCMQFGVGVMVWALRRDGWAFLVSK